MTSITPPVSKGPNGVLNGTTLAASTTYWNSTNCSVEAELSADHGFWSVVVDSAGTMSTGGEEWAVGPDANSVTVGPGNGGLQGFFWITALGEITGSVASKTFTATVTVKTGDTPQVLGTCTFDLKQGNLE
ncbi:MAG: hypothetical protein ACLPY1_17510 [Terracidiphilus sp.]